MLYSQTSVLFWAWCSWLGNWYAPGPVKYPEQIIQAVALKCVFCCDLRLQLFVVSKSFLLVTRCTWTGKFKIQYDQHVHIIQIIVVVLYNWIKVKHSVKLVNIRYTPALNCITANFLTFYQSHFSLWESGMVLSSL